jgi:Domain of unknown function (DUF5615)
VKILIDAQMPPALAGWLKEQGHEAQAVRDVGLREAEDGAIWTYAKQTGAVILTKDEDFAARSHQTPDGPVSFGCASATVRTPPCARGWNQDCPASCNSSARATGWLKWFEFFSNRRSAVSRHPMTS